VLSVADAAGPLCGFNRLPGPNSVLIGGIASLAQSAGDRVSPGPHYSLTMHVLAMTALATLAVAVAAVLEGIGRTELAGFVLVATVAGPMTLVAAPASGSVLEPSMADTTLAWHVAVGAVLLAIMATWTWLIVRTIGKRTSDQDSTPAPVRSSWMGPDLVFCATAVLAVEAYARTPQQADSPSGRAIIGWAVLAAGIVTAVAFGRRWWVAPAALVGAGAVLGLVFLAYSRVGGWPGVAGWEYDGMEPPIITSVASTGSLLAASALGLALRAVSRTFALGARGVGLGDPSPLPSSPR
jgi:hypothetical protein